MFNSRKKKLIDRMKMNKLHCVVNNASIIIP